MCGICFEECRGSGHEVKTAISRPDRDRDEDAPLQPWKPTRAGLSEPCAPCFISCARRAKNGGSSPAQERGARTTSVSATAVPPPHNSDPRPSFVPGNDGLETGFRGAAAARIVWGWHGQTTGRARKTERALSAGPRPQRPPHTHVHTPRSALVASAGRRSPLLGEIQLLLIPKKL